MLQSRSIWASACACFLSASAPSENRFYLHDGALPAGGMSEHIPLLEDNDEDMLGYTFGLEYDPEFLAVTAVSAAGSISERADYFEGGIDSEGGQVGYGCVLTFNSAPAKILRPGAGRTLANLEVDVHAGVGAVTRIAFVDLSLDPDPARPSVQNVFTSRAGRTVPVNVSPGTFTVEDRTPRITSLLDNEGRPGDVFRVVGSFLDEPGLIVQVCALAAVTTLEPDGATLLVTAPGCGSPGLASLRLCTIRGCDERAEGFNYLPPPDTELVRGDANGDQHVDISDGIWLLLFLFLGGQPSRCHDAMDTNDDATVDLSDAAWIFNFLFRGGSVIRPPYPQTGTDPTPDDLPGC